LGDGSLVRQRKGDQQRSYTITTPVSLGFGNSLGVSGRCVLVTIGGVALEEAMRSERHFKFRGTAIDEGSKGSRIDTPKAKLPCPRVPLKIPY